MKLNPTVQPRWALAAVLAALPLAGALMAWAEHDAAPLYVSLAAVPLMVACALVFLLVYAFVLRVVLPALFWLAGQGRRAGLPRPSVHGRPNA